MADHDGAHRGDGGTLVCQTAMFEPAGLFGLLYWYGLLPVHALIFGGILRAIARGAQSGDA